MYIRMYTQYIRTVCIRILTVALVYVHNWYVCNVYIHTYICTYVCACSVCIGYMRTVRLLRWGLSLSKDGGNVCYNRRLRRPQIKRVNVCVSVVCVKMVEEMAVEEVQSLLLVKILGMKPGWKETMFQV